MARKPAVDAARARFAALLAGHLSAGTRPATASGEPWTYAAFAAEVQSSRNEEEFVSPRSVSNWCRGTALPAEIDPICRALFGPSNRHGEAREALRRAFTAARTAKAAAVLAKDRPDRAGERWITTDGTLAIDRTPRPTDRRAAADPQRRQLQEAIRALAADLAERAKRLANTRTWGGLAATASGFEAVVRADPLAIPDRLGSAYAHLLGLGRLLETDMRVQRDPACADDPLDADIHGLLTDLVCLAAPWLRGFPTVAAWDDAAGRALVRANLFQPAREFVRIARDRQAIPAQDAAAVESLGAAAEADGFQGSKAGARLVGTARNLMVAEAEAVAVDRARNPATPFAERPLLVRRVQAALAAAGPQREALSETFQPDLRQAVWAAAEAGEASDEADAALDGSTAGLPIPEDVEAQARAMILEGQAPPSAWRPFIRELDFSFSRLNDVSLLAALTGLQTLNLWNTPVADITALNPLIGLRSLHLSETYVDDIAPLVALTGLQFLDLSSMQIGDIAPLAALTRLQALYLMNTQVDDIVPLAALTGLQALYLMNTQVDDIAPLAALTGLQTLDLSRTQVGDIVPVAALTGLQTLDLSSTEVGNIAPVAALTGLQALDLSYTLVVDVSPLSALKNLRSLDLRGTRVSDVSPLGILTGLRSLDLTGTPVRDISALSHLDVEIVRDIPDADQPKPRPAGSRRPRRGGRRG